jgi:hypothetical protein
MKRALWIAATCLAATSSIALAQGSPESILPPGFRNPAPAPAPAPAPSPEGADQPTPRVTSSPVVQPLPSQSGSGGGGGGSSSRAPAPVDLPDNLPSLRELADMSNDEIDELLGLKPKYDIPPAARRQVKSVGVLSEEEGGLPAQSLAGQPPALVAAVLAGLDGPVVSRWGHIMVRRALASRLDAPDGMNPVRFAALRARALNALGEPGAARALVQDIDSDNYDEALADAALDAYIATGDFTGICPVARLQGNLLETTDWQLSRSICNAFSGQDAAMREMTRTLNRGEVPAIDVLLAQRYAGAAGENRRAVTIQWDDVDELTPWRFGLLTALGMDDVPDSLWSGSDGRFDTLIATNPANDPVRRAAHAEAAMRAGIMSAASGVDLYSQVFAAGVEGEEADRATRLRNAYVAGQQADRVAAIRAIWGNDADYGDQVLTAYAAARITPADDQADNAAPLIASMLTAGLDANAMRWAPHVDEGSQAWALLVLAQPSRSEPVDSGAIGSFAGDGQSAQQRRTQFLVAGLAGLGRLDEGDAQDLSEEYGARLGVNSRWSETINAAAQADNAALVMLLAGLGMQGEGWERMTARHLYHIVRALDAVGLSAEARMIAAEAVARA